MGYKRTGKPPFNHFLGYPQQEKLGDYNHMISDNQAANLAYAATFNGEQDVYFVRITPDCNGNDIADETDLEEGTSDDCNENKIPDECESDLDCNNNSVQDICDTALGTSDDCNVNSVKYRQGSTLKMHNLVTKRTVDYLMIASIVDLYQVRMM